MILRGTRGALPSAMTSQSNRTQFVEIKTEQLREIAGGVGGVLTPMPNMGAPKYSAQWWDIVRSRGIAK